jgi:hypothetical protein
VSNEVNILITATDRASAVLTKATGGVKGLNSSFQSLTGISLGAAGGIAAVVAGVKQSIDFTMKYADEVSNLSRTIGATTQESSRLIQVSDDVKISTDQLTVALNASITKGYAPTIDGLMHMSDAYLAIQDPIARAKYLVDTFGRSGREMGRLMELGSEGIKKAGESAKMILSPADIQKMKDFYLATDDLSDSFDALKVSVGLAASGPISQFFQTLSNGITVMGQLDRVNTNFMMNLHDILYGTKSGGATEQWLNDLRVADENLNKELDKTPPKIQAIGDEANKQVTPTGSLADQMYAMVRYLNGLHDKTYTITTILKTLMITGTGNTVFTGGGGSRSAPNMNAFGGSYKIPAAFGFEGANPAPGLSASGGERVTVTPEGQNQEVDLSEKTIRKMMLMMRDVRLTSL